MLSVIVPYIARRELRLYRLEHESMSSNYPDALQVYSDFVDDLRSRNLSWEEIYFAGGEEEEDIPTLLRAEGRKYGLPKSDYYTPEQWKQLVSEKKKREEKEKQLIIDANTPPVIKGALNNLSMPDSRRSMWQVYKSRLKRKGFSSESIANITKTTESLLRTLNPSTPHDQPFRGLVVGNVQSGKTANMTGLISAAADNGFNMFIVLSGMIDSLRVQTEERFKADLDQDSSTLRWKIFTNLGPSCTDPLSSCDFRSRSNFRYLTVVLKNSRRLEQLIGWLKSDPNKLAQMKILIIDDEADQASINTKDISKEEQGRINSLIRQIVFSTYWGKEQKPVYPQAVDYVAFTATPFANVLNESGKDSLFPEDMIYSLPVSSEYFGPQQIFGLREEFFPDDEGDIKIEGLNIVRPIPEDQIRLIEKDQNGTDNRLPETLKDAACWFLSSVAALRWRGEHRPFTMLVHTSQKTACHKDLGSLIFKWLKNTSMDDMLERCRKVWEKETSQLTLKDFEMVMDRYPMKTVENYPEFDLLEDELKELLAEKVQHINIDSDRNLIYGNGLHLCIDNSTSGRGNEDGEYLRLLYPKAGNMPEKAPAFLVIGGMTLSRGLTLEGLISTYFLRTTKYGDSLMQMGRWFGYRRGYELYPRIWMSEAAIRRFEYLSLIDYELRRTIEDMVRTMKTPGEIGVMVRKAPTGLLQLTAKNKMQSAAPASRRFSGLDSQTKLFDEDSEIQKNNLKLTEDFLKKLGRPASDSKRFDGKARVWLSVPSKEVCSYLRNFHFQKNLKLSRQIGDLLAWISSEAGQGRLNHWNIILPSRGANASQWGADSYQIGMVSRSKIKNESDSEVINVGAVKTPTDALADIPRTADFEEKRALAGPLQKPEAIDRLRKEMGVSNIPLLIIYIIDKNSKPGRPNRTERVPLNSAENLVGLSIRIPGTKVSQDYVEYLSAVRSQREEFADDADIEED